MLIQVIVPPTDLSHYCKIAPKIRIKINLPSVFYIVYKKSANVNVVFFELNIGQFMSYSLPRHLLIKSTRRNVKRRQHSTSNRFLSATERHSH